MRIIPVCIQVPALFLSFCLVLASGQAGAQPFKSDTLEIFEADEVPVMDGIANDFCWSQTAWEPINQVWITWGEELDSADFYGRYKILWSAGENLLYVLAEVTDDINVDGYQYKSTPQNNNYPDYDILELFIDENASGGKHVFDGSGSVATEWGSNAENAVSYHIMADQPADGDVVTTFDVCDIAGTDWGNYFIANYDSHFPEFVLARNGNRYTWEFSLKVYGEDLDPAAAEEEQRVELAGGKVMGLSLAYCENDQEGTPRDHFIGSVWVPEERYNNHWMDAGDYRTAVLVAKAAPTIVATAGGNFAYTVYDPANRQVRVRMNPVGMGVRVYNMQGILVQQVQSNEKTGPEVVGISFEDLPNGVYLIRPGCSIHSASERICVY